MVHVIVGQEYGIQVTDVFPQHLRAEIRSGIDEYLESTVFHQRGGAQAFVARVLRETDRAVAADDRYALRRSRSQESKFCFAHSQMNMSVSFPTSASS